MSVDDFLEYVAFNQIEPFGDEREDLRAAIMPWLITGYFAKKGKAPKFEEFILANMLNDEPVKTKPRQSVSQMETTLKGLFESTK